MWENAWSSLRMVSSEEATAFELQRDVGHRADDRDQRHGRRHRLALAVARADEVGDRGDVVGLGELDHAAQHAGVPSPIIRIGPT